MNLSKSLLLVIGLFSLIPSMVQAEGITVLSAVVKNKVISGAKVTYQKNGAASLRVTTNSLGKASENALSNDKEATMLIQKEGYSTLVVKCPCDGFTYALSPKMNNLDGMRIVLTWGKRPSDLDSHLVFPGNNVYFSSKVGDESNLDVDDTNSYGPETITIENKKVGERYVYAIRDYGNSNRTGTYALSNSDARVDVYIGQTLMRSYNVKKNVAANVWVIFGIDGDGAFHDINQYVSFTSDRSYFKHLNNIVAADTFNSNDILTDAIKKQARRINVAGEKAYAKKHYEQAMYLFLQSINLNPKYSKAYGNLGVTYPKLNRNAEALWANRKAIDLASGSRAATIKAGSYYNIARIYEKSGKWNEALTNFQNALNNKEHSAYRKGIKRIRDALKENGL